MIIDTPDNVTSKLIPLKGAGVTSIIRYLNPLGRTSKVVTPTEAKAIATAGLRMGLVSEGWGDFAHSAINAATGTRDARNAFDYAPTVGASAGSATIYFAIDTDATDAQIQNDIIPYFQAIKDYNLSHAGGQWSVGVYGCGAACATLQAKGLVSRTWLANAMGWNGSRSYTGWYLKQHLPTKLAGVDVDYNDAGVVGFGDFIPFHLAPALVPETGLQQVQDIVTSMWSNPIPAPVVPVIVSPSLPPVSAPAPAVLSTAQITAIVQAAAISYADSYISANVPGLFSGMALSAVQTAVPGLSQAVVAALLKKGKFV